MDEMTIDDPLPLSTPLLWEDLIEPFATVTFPHLDVLEKFQQRINGETRQVIRNSSVVIKIKSTEQICRVLAWVIRVRCSSLTLPDDSYKIALPNESIKIRHIETDEYAAEIDLNSVYYIPKRKVPFYKLDTGGKEKNMFKLVIQLEYVDGSLSQMFSSVAFQLRTEPSAGQSKRVMGSISADFGQFNRLVVKEKFVPPAGTSDIAYHFELCDPNKKFVEGDVVGFFEQTEGGETYINELTVENNDRIVHAGVISRSAYLEANRSVDKETIATDTVCVLGIVKVKVVGSVQAGERVYASNAFPGKAVPQSHLLHGLGERKEVLLGMALQSAKPNQLDEVLLVRCFVCVVLGVSSLETWEDLKEVYDSQKLETKTEIKIANKRQWKRLCCFFTLFISFLALLSITIYEIFAPGSNFRYWLCRRGAKPGSYEFKYVFSPVKDPLGLYEANGLEFTYDALRDKTSPFSFPKRTVNTSNPIHSVTHYYLNIDRCAYGYAYGNVGNVIGGYRKIGGGKVFAINWNCTIIYWAAENPYWTTYNRTNTLRCFPKMPY